MNTQTRSTKCQYRPMIDRKSTRLNSSHLVISYAVFCLKKKKMAERYILHHPDLRLAASSPPPSPRELILPEAHNSWYVKSDSFDSLIPVSPTAAPSPR